MATIASLRQRGIDKVPDEGVGREASHRSARAFTLVELAIVVVLLAIMAALVLPEMRGSYDAELLRNTGRHLVRALNLAYSQSVITRQRHRVQIDPANRRFWVEYYAANSMADTAESPPPGYAPVRDLPGCEGTFDARIQVDCRQAIDHPSILPDEEIPPDTASSAGAGTRANNPFQAAPGEISQNTIVFFPDGTAEGKEILLADRQRFQLLLRVHPVTARVDLVDPRDPSAR